MDKLVSPSEFTPGAYFPPARFYLPPPQTAAPIRDQEPMGAIAHPNDYKLQVQLTSESFLQPVLLVIFRLGSRFLYSEFMGLSVIKLFIRGDIFHR